MVAEPTSLVVQVEMDERAFRNETIVRRMRRRRGWQDAFRWGGAEAWVSHRARTGGWAFLLDARPEGCYPLRAPRISTTSCPRPGTHDGESAARLGFPLSAPRIARRSGSLAPIRFAARVTSPPSFRSTSSRTRAA